MELTPMRILPTHPLGAAAVALALIGLFALGAYAHHYRLESASPAAPFLHDGRADAAIEPSGVAPLGDGRRVLVVDEKAAGLHVVDVATGALVGAPLGSSKLPPTTKTGPRWEGMAVDSEGNYYLVGSHSGESDEDRAANSAVVRFRLRSGDPPTIEDDSVVRWNIAGPLEAALRAEGLDEARVAEREVGGLTVREVGGRRDLVIGLRKPDDKVRAFGADITDAPSPEATLALRRTFAFDPGRPDDIAPQLTSLEYVPEMGGFLVLTTMVGRDNAFHGNTLSLVNNGQPNAARAYATFEKGMKAGGLAVLGIKATGHRTEIKLLITYDNDPHATGLPSRFQTALLVHPRS
jgi:hypothetical protein